jgi:hypothetical protein
VVRANGYLLCLSRRSALTNLIRNDPPPVQHGGVVKFVEVAREV